MISNFEVESDMYKEVVNQFDQVAISEEFREWLNDGVSLEDVLKLEMIKNNNK